MGLVNQTRVRWVGLFVVGSLVVTGCTSPKTVTPSPSGQATAPTRVSSGAQASPGASSRNASPSSLPDTSGSPPPSGYAASRPAAVQGADGVEHRRQSNYLMPPVPALTAAQKHAFDLGNKTFLESTMGHGLGPVANGMSCTTCHVNPIGAASNIRVIRYGRLTKAGFDPMVEHGGPLLHTLALAGFKAETVPALATVRAVRRSPQLFGLGLVDAIPDAAIEAQAHAQMAQHPGLAGRVARVKSPRDHQLHVGRFGFKCQHGRLEDMVADGLVSELGVSNAIFPMEPQYNRAPRKVGPAELEDRPDGTGKTRVQRLTDFTRFLAPLPPAATSTNTHTTAGQHLFAQVGCASCHLPSYVTQSPVQALDHKTVALYSDFLLHDIGTGDGIVQGAATGREMRTAPLAGMQLQPFYLHDGSARTVEEAVARHDGQALGVRHRFEALSRNEQASLLKFVQSL